jgi:hypothetical protein
MSYLLSGLDLVVNNTTSITVNTSQTTIQGDIAPQDNVIAVNSTVTRFATPDNLAVALIKSTSTAASLINVTAKALNTTEVPISATVEGNGLKNLITNYYEGITYTPQLLTCVGVNDTSTTIGDLSSNNFIFTNNNTATVSNLTPFLSSRAYSSILFNGTSQSLTTTVAASSSLDLATGAGNWTIEGWFYTTSIVGSKSIVWKTAAGNPSYALWISATTPQWIVGDGASSGTSFNLAAITANTWYHFALVRNGNTLTPYMNGVSQTGGTIVSAMGNGGASTTLYIGAASDGRYFPGYISNVRIVKGSALYLGNFLPPTTNFSAASITNITTKVSASTTYTKLIYEPLNINLYNSLKYTSPTGQTEVYDPDLVGNSRINSYVVSNLSNKSIVSDTKIVNIALSPEFYVNGPDAPIVLSTEGRGTTTTTTLTTTLITPVQGGGSFNGTNQYLSIPSTTLFAMGTNNFTIEGWVYMTSYTNSVAGGGLFGTAGGSPATSGYYLNLGQNINTLRITSNASGAWQDDITVTTGNGVPLNTWTHLAMVRNGNSLVLYKNGVSVASRTDITTWNYSSLSNNGYIGYANDGSGTVRYFTGYMSNIRVVQGVAVYTGNFTVPTKPLTKEQNAGTNIQAILGTQTTLLTLQNLETLVDNSSLANTISNNNAVTIASAYSPTWTPYLAPLSTGGFKFTGGASEYFTLPALNTVFQFGTGDFTIELWVYITKNQTGYIYDTRPTTTQGAYATLYYSSVAGWISYDTDASSRLTALVSLNTWYHVAVCRISGISKLYLNGTQSGSSYTSSSSYLTSSSLTHIGASTYTTGAAPFAGQISNLRVVKGLAVYTGNFTVPTSPLTNTQTSSTNISPILGGYTSLIIAQDSTILDRSLYSNILTSSVSSVTPSGLYGPVVGVSTNTSTIANIAGAYVSTPTINETNIEYINYRTDPRSVNKRVKNLIVGTTGVLEELQSWS